MTAAHDYEYMRRLLDHLTPGQVRRLRLIVSQDEELSLVAETVSAERGEGVPAGLLALIGSVESSRQDVAERHDDSFRPRPS